MRIIPAKLQAHLESSCTTTCLLLKITTTDGDVYGLATHNRDITYDGVTYSAINGFDQSTIASSTGYDVDNSEGYALLAADVDGISLTDAKSGKLNDAKWQLMLVNWSDLTMGHLVMDAGDIGEVTVTDNAVFAPELLSYTMRLKQAIGHVDQRRCRAIFGSPPNTQTGCGVNASSMWSSHSVTAIDAESNRLFVCSSLIGQNYYPARITWTSGNNSSSLLYQVEYFDSSTGLIGLFEPVPFDIESGDTFSIRKDCDKSVDSCKAYGNFLNYKGEPLIPVGEG